MAQKSEIMQPPMGTLKKYIRDGLAGKWNRAFCRGILGDFYVNISIFTCGEAGRSMFRKRDLVGGH